MSFQFGDLQVVEKTFTREAGAVRTQAYNGIKFRRYTTKKGEKEALEAGKVFVPFVEETFYISNAAYALLNLEENALTQTIAPDGSVILLAVTDNDEQGVKPKFMRRSFSKADGTPAKKGKMFSNEFLSEPLVKSGVLDGVVHGNQYLSLQAVDIAGAPAEVKGAYMLVKDVSVSEEADAEETAAEGTTTESRDF